MRGTPLLWRLFPTYLVITLASLAAVIWFATDSFRSFEEERTRALLTVRARVVRSEFTRLGASRTPAQVEALCRRAGELMGTRVTITDARGRVLGDSEREPEAMESHLNRPEIMTALRGEPGAATRFSNTLRMNLVYVALPVEENGEVVAVVRTSLPETRIRLAWGAMRNHMIGAGLVVALLAALMSLMVSRWITRPIAEMRAGARRFARGDLSMRLPAPRSAELSGLAESLNDMAAQLEERIRTSDRERREIAAVLGSMVEGVIAVDMGERILSMNRAAAEFCHADPERARGRDIQEVLRNAELHRFVTRVLAGEDLREGDIMSVVNGGERHFQLHGTALRDPRGEQVGAVIVLNEVTRLRRLETVRRDFVANVTHEIRTPLTSIKGFADALLEDGGDPEQRERFLRIIVRQADRLNAIIDDLLSLARLESDGEKGGPPMAPCALSGVVRAAVELCHQKGARRGVTVDVECPDDLTVSCNGALIEQAVANLVENAVKYSGEGGRVLVTAEPAGDGARIAVRDWGCGIEARHLPRIFERFYRVDKSRSRALGGTGLGLSIVKHIVQAHGGSVQVESEPGKGSTFTLVLPGRGARGDQAAGD